MTAGDGGRAPAREAFPWSEVMAFGLGVLRLPPAEFWRMSIPELAAAIEGVHGRAPATGRPARGDFAALMLRFPDTTNSRTSP
jgi:uncharacterized phage protein (TIGR02216 family)